MLRFSPVSLRMFAAILLICCAFGTLAYVPPEPEPEMMNEEYFVAVNIVKEDCKLYDSAGKDKKILCSMKAGDLITVLHQLGERSNGVLVRRYQDFPEWTVVLWQNKPAYIATAHLNPNIGLGKNEEYTDDDIRGMDFFDVDRSYIPQLIYVRAHNKNINVYQEVETPGEGGGMRLQFQKTGRLPAGSIALHDGQIMGENGKNYARVLLGNYQYGYVEVSGLRSVKKTTLEKNLAEWVEKNLPQGA